jgi:hypothetical protein
MRNTLITQAKQKINRTQMNFSFSRLRKLNRKKSLKILINIWTKNILINNSKRIM